MNRNHIRNIVTSYLQAQGRPYSLRLTKLLTLRLQGIYEPRITSQEEIDVDTILFNWNPFIESPVVAI